MSLLSFFSLLVFFFYFTLGVYVLFYDHKSRLHRNLFYLSLAFAVYALAYSFYYNSPEKESAILWFKISSVGWTLIPAIIVNFTFSLTRIEFNIRNWIIQPLVFLVALIFLFQSLTDLLYPREFIWNGTFWRFSPDFDSVWFWFFHVYLFSYMILTVMLIAVWRKQTTLNKEKKKTRIILISLIVSCLLSATTRIILPLAGFSALPEMEHFFCIILFGGFSYAIIQYRDNSLTAQLAASTIISEIRQGVIFTDVKGIINFANENIAKLLGYYSEDLMFRNIYDFIDDQPVRFDDEPELSTFTKLRNDLNAITRDGNIIPVELFTKAHNDRFDDLTGFIFIFQDKRPEQELRRVIEERQLLHYELFKAKEKADESDQLKSAFLSNISHELRTPLNGILGFTEILKMEIDDPSIREIAEHIDMSGNRLLGTLNSIIDLSLIETNKHEIDKEIVNLTDLLLSKTNLYKSYANSKNISLETILPDQSVESRTDQRLLGHIINNLLDNAIKYTEKGGVTVTLDRIRSGKRHWALIKVKDTGIGIDSSDYSVIFESFRQGSEGSNRIYEGMGIGLSICKHFVNLLDGEIWLESEPGKGSEFFVKIPSFPGSDGEALKQIEEGSSLTENGLNTNERPCVLVVDNEKPNREYVKYSLSEYFDVDTISSSFKVPEMISKNNYEAIFININPDNEMSGIEAMKKIREQENYQQVAISVVSANAMNDIKEGYLDVGFSHFLAKPFDRGKLLQLTRDMIKYTRSSQ